MKIVLKHPAPRKVVKKNITVKMRVAAKLRKAAFLPATFLAKSGTGRTISELKQGDNIFSQGDDADAVFYVQKGKIKLTVISKTGKEATTALLGEKHFLGEECITAIQTRRRCTATTLTPSTILRIERSEMVRVLHEEKLFSEIFVAYLLARNVRVQEDLIDQLFNSSEKRLAPKSARKPWRT
jgi:CRP-like cAMP-binding protein